MESGNNMRVGSLTDGRPVIYAIGGYPERMPYLTHEYKAPPRLERLYTVGTRAIRWYNLVYKQ